MRYLVFTFILACLVSCIGGKSKPVQFYTLDVQGSSDFKLYVREVSSGANIHERITLKSGSSIELMEFDRWEESPRRLVEVEMKNYFDLGGQEIRTELNEFIFDLKNKEARVSMDCVFLKEDNTRKFFRVKSSEVFEDDDAASLTQAMSKALTKLFVKMDHKLNEL